MNDLNKVLKDLDHTKTKIRALENLCDNRADMSKIEGALSEIQFFIHSVKDEIDNMTVDDLIKTNNFRALSKIGCVGAITTTILNTIGTVEFSSSDSNSATILTESGIEVKVEMDDKKLYFIVLSDEIVTEDLSNIILKSIDDIREYADEVHLLTKSYDIEIKLQKEYC